VAENIIEQVVAGLRATVPAIYPQHGELRNVRVVGHTPKLDHYIYDIVVDFAGGSERIAAKIYRGAKLGAAGARGMAKTEAQNLARVYDIFLRRSLSGVPRPIGDFTDLGAVAAEKITGLPLQSIIMKAALLPGYADRGLLTMAARRSGEWLRSFHKATADGNETFDCEELLAELEGLCISCRGEGLEESSVRVILNGARAALARGRKSLPRSAVLVDFTPLNVIVGEQGIGISDYAHMQPRGASLSDAALFLASVEALEKYPFCNRAITACVQDEFLDSYGISPAEDGILRVLKMKALLKMFAQGRTVKESATRKKIMWATVMKRFIHNAASRSLAPAA
jgi:hypothetical protein